MMSNSSQTIPSQTHPFPFCENAQLANTETIFNISMNNPYLLSDSNLAFYLVVCILTFLISIGGILGNGMVIWLLSFRLKRNPFTTYILNLAVADIVVLISSIVGYLVVIIFHLSREFQLWGLTIYAAIFSSMYITDQLLLTTISIDRCVAVLFPLWYRCHRPPHLSRTVCILLWVLSFLITGLEYLLLFANVFALLEFIVSVTICTPLMSVSTIILFVKIFTKSQQRKRGKLLMAISLTLFFFLVFGAPVNYCYIVFRYYFLDATDVKSLLSSELSYSELNSRVVFMLLCRAGMATIPMMTAFVCTVFNCSINPLIYFLVGRKKKGRSQLSMKFALQQVIKEEENCRGQDRPVAETQF